jgi:hypothetical protein
LSFAASLVVCAVFWLTCVSYHPTLLPAAIVDSIAFGVSHQTSFSSDVMEIAGQFDTRMAGKLCKLPEPLVTTRTLPSPGRAQATLVYAQARIDMRKRSDQLLDQTFAGSGIRQVGGGCSATQRHTMVFPCPPNMARASLAVVTCASLPTGWRSCSLFL